MKNKLELIGVIVGTLWFLLVGTLLLGVTVIAVITLVIRTVWFW